MSNKKPKKEENLLNKTSNQASGFINSTADTSNKIAKSIVGKGGLFGKATDTSTDFVKNVSNTGNKYFQKSVNTSSNIVKGTGKKIFPNKKNKHPSDPPHGDKN